MTLSVGVTCFPTFGGSGIVATEIGVALARRGHRVHFICSDAPRRLDRGVDNVFFHQVRALDYPVFPVAPYSLALCSAMVSVATWEGLDVLHAHYAVPHATAAWMAREVLGDRGPRVVTTLHGTDITLVGSDESYLPITRHSIARSDAVTAPSEHLRAETWSRFALDPERVPIEVIPNAVDTQALRPLGGELRPRLAALFGDAAHRVPTLVHVSNFRPLKRVDLVVEAFARLAADRPLFLVLVGDGPERGRVEALARQRGVFDRVRFPGGLDHFEDLLRECAVFLLPSESESFGLAALEALASGVPVVASRVGGVPEVVRDGLTGLLVPPGDAASLEAATRRLLDDPALRARMGAAGREDAVLRFRMDPMVDRYERVFERALASPSRVGPG